MSQYKHVVLLRLSPQTPREAVAGIFETLDELPTKIPGILDVSSGSYDSPEGLNKGFTHGIVLTFADGDSRDRCLAHPEFEAFRALMLGEMAGGLADLIAFDFKVCDRFRY